MSDGSRWRYEYHGMQPATAEDRKDFDELMETWKKLGTKLEDLHVIEIPNIPPAGKARSRFSLQ